MLKISKREVQEILNSTNWRLYNLRVSWAVRSPSCHLYDSNVLCSYWRNWILQGQDFYEKKEYLKALQEVNPKITHSLLNQILKENQSSQTLSVCVFNT